jgi:hypothetical protein
MKNKNTDLKPSKVESEKLAELNYPPNEDIFNKLTEEKEIDPEDISKYKTPTKPRNSKWNEKNFREDVSGSDLDIPGAEMDDAMEQIGSEDEENNGYSLGGDDHNDLDEDTDSE